VPAHCIDSTDLTPPLDMAMAAHDMAEQASEARKTFGLAQWNTCGRDLRFKPSYGSELTDLAPALDTATCLLERGAM
jgi:hypothetical protein